MARTHKNGYELLLFLKENGMSLQDAKHIIATAEAEITKWKARKEMSGNDKEVRP